jgi:hypothetical protein
MWFMVFLGAIGVLAEVFVTKLTILIKGEGQTYRQSTNFKGLDKLPPPFFKPLILCN